LFQLKVGTVTEKEVSSIKEQLLEQRLPDDECILFCSELKKFVSSEESNLYKKSFKSWCINKRNFPSVDFIEIIQEDISTHHGKFWYGTFSIDM
jgi:hypothetical protein